MMEEDSPTTSNNSTETVTGFAIKNAAGDLARSSGFAFDSSGFDWTLSSNPGSALKGWSLCICDVAAPSGFQAAWAYRSNQIITGGIG